MGRPAGRGRVRGATEGLRLRGSFEQDRLASESLVTALTVLRRPAALAGVVILAAGFLLLDLHRWGNSWLGWMKAPLLITLAAVIVLDLTARVIPNVLTIPGLAYALALTAITDRSRLPGAVVGVAVAGGALLLMGLLGGKGIGGGDIKLAALLCAALGWGPALIAIALSQAVGLAGILAVSLARRRLVRTPVPVGAPMALFGAILLIANP